MIEYESRNKIQHDVSIKSYRCDSEQFTMLKAMFNGLPCYRDLGKGRFGLCCKTLCYYASHPDSLPNRRFLFNNGFALISTLTSIPKTKLKSLSEHYDILQFNLSVEQHALPF